MFTIYYFILFCNEYCSLLIAEFIHKLRPSLWALAHFRDLYFDVFKCYTTQRIRWIPIRVDLHVDVLVNTRIQLLIRAVLYSRFRQEIWPIYVHYVIKDLKQNFTALVNFSVEYSCDMRENKTAAKITGYTVSTVLCVCGWFCMFMKFWVLTLRCTSGGWTKQPVVKQGTGTTRHTILIYQAHIHIYRPYKRPVIQWMYPLNILLFYMDHMCAIHVCHHNSAITNFKMA